MDWHTPWSPGQPVRRGAPVSCAIKAWRTVILSSPVYDPVIVTDELLLIFAALCNNLDSF
jgi:hypothetical protein